ncbi:hypothetical protein PAXRUDRAFT_822241 [Paxillus rubicundulus Ve08.2h10]|uniref:Uncharacterized protein n=1 Tax=Paxillus rubicundulus Ve08.2h10 TaxID=930991 RepID=A0A0D0ECS5_9AGAM|nr:hypothetical protein PAXRUDRAFT_822241 [Paxillus rubicundulus Ve08.2h10]
MLQGGYIISGIRQTGTPSGRPATNADVDEPAFNSKNVFTGGLLSKRIGRPAFAEVGTAKPSHTHNFIPRDLKQEVRNIKGLFGRRVDSSASNSRTLSFGDFSNNWIGHQNFRDPNQRSPGTQPSGDSMVLDTTAWSPPSYCQSQLQLNQQNDLSSTYPVISMDAPSASLVVPTGQQDSMQSVKMNSPSFSLRKMSLEFPFRKRAVRSSSQMSVDGPPSPVQAVHPRPRDPERALSLAQQAEQFFKEIVGLSRHTTQDPPFRHQGETDLQPGDPLNSLKTPRRFPSGRVLVGKINGLGKIRTLLSRSKERAPSHLYSATVTKPYSRPVESFPRRPFLSRKRKLTLSSLSPVGIGLDEVLNEALTDSRSAKPTRVKCPRLRRRQDSGPPSLLFAPPSAEEYFPPEGDCVLSHPEPSNATTCPHGIKRVFYPDESHPIEGQRKTRRRQRSPSPEADAEWDNQKDHKKKRLRLDSRPSPVVVPGSQVNVAPTPERQLSSIEGLPLPRPFQEEPRQARQPRSNKVKGHERYRAGAAAADAVYTKATQVHRNGRRGRLRASSEPLRPSSQFMQPADNSLRVLAVNSSRLTQRALPSTPQLPAIPPEQSLEDTFISRCDSPEQLSANLPTISITYPSAQSTSMRQPSQRGAGDCGPRRKSSNGVDFYLGDAKDLGGFLATGRRTGGTLGSFAGLRNALRDIERGSD